MAIGDSKFKQLPKSVNELIADRAIRHALYLERYKTQMVNDILTEFNRTLSPELIAKIEKSLERITLKSKRMQILFKDNGELIREEYKVMEAKLYEQLRDFAKVESSWLIKTLENITPIAFDFVAPSANILKSLVTTKPMEGALVKDWFDKLARDTTFNVNRAIQINSAIQSGMIEGKGIADIVRSIKGTRAANYGDGILNAPRYQLNAVVRTCTSNVSHLAREEVYAVNTDVVKGVEIISTLDPHTCLECMNLDGKVFDIGEGRRPPFHHGCRCSDAPVLKSWKELGIDAKELDPGTRASMNGQVAATQTYPAWLKKQTTEIQNEALGVGRAELFRSGQLKLNDFINRLNKPLTLKELEKIAG
jgi:SPP1 gp7 family putative phage head morphogenesis protein